MDLTMIDCMTDLPEPGDEVVLWRAGKRPPAAGKVAAWSDTLPYEILCTIGKRVNRTYLRAGRPGR
jgi:alanine racemase